MWGGAVKSWSRGLSPGHQGTPQEAPSPIKQRFLLQKPKPPALPKIVHGFPSAQNKRHTGPPDPPDLPARGSWLLAAPALCLPQGPHLRAFARTIPHLAHLPSPPQALHARQQGEGRVRRGPHHSGGPAPSPKPIIPHPVPTAGSSVIPPQDLLCISVNIPVTSDCPGVQLSPPLGARSGSRNSPSLVP